MKQIFVYGSLRKGMYNYERYLKGKSHFVGYGYVKGCLYALKDAAYPALLDGDQDVFGEIYEIDEQVASAIDELEGCHKAVSYTHLDVYKRQPIPLPWFGSFSILIRSWVLYR